MALPADPHATDEFSSLVPSALAGDSAAWNTLVDRLSRVVWRALSGFSLSSEDRKDAFAATFCRLFERLDTVREPAKLPGWVATTARNEALTLLRGRQRLIPTELESMSLPPTSGDHSNALETAELHVALRAGLARLSASCQELLRVLTIDPPLSYAEVSALLGIPHGSIGPSRQRCLRALRETPELRGFLEGGAR